MGDFIARYELLSGLGVVAIGAGITAVVRHIRLPRIGLPSPTAVGPAPDPKAGVVAARKVDLHQTLFDLMHTAAGRVIHLYGLREEPDFDDYSIEQLTNYMTARGFPGKTQAGILDAWENDRKGAKKELREVRRRAEIAEADQAYTKAWNYYVGNSIYLSDRIQAKTREAFAPLRSIIAFAKFPDPGSGRDVTRWTGEATELIEQLGLLIHEDLGLANREAGDRTRPRSG